MNLQYCALLSAQYCVKFKSRIFLCLTDNNKGKLVFKFLIKYFQKEIVNCDIPAQLKQVKPEDIIANDFCLCCSPGIKCIKASGVSLAEIPDSENFISIKN